MHCFIPYDIYTDDLHKAIVSLMKGETKCTSVLWVIGDGKGVHLYSWKERNEFDIPIYDPEEPITTVQVNAGTKTITISIP